MATIRRCDEIRGVGDYRRLIRPERTGSCAVSDLEASCL